MAVKLETNRLLAAGRVHAISAVKLLGGLLLAWMSVDKGMWRNAPLVVTVYLLRTMANNSTYALQKSILMDFVPKELFCPLHLCRSIVYWFTTGENSCWPVFPGHMQDG